MRAAARARDGYRSRTGAAEPPPPPRAPSSCGLALHAAAHVRGHGRIGAGAAPVGCAERQSRRDAGVRGVDRQRRGPGARSESEDCATAGDGPRTKSRRRRGCHVDISRRPTWMVRSRRRRGCMRRWSNGTPDRAGRRLDHPRTGDGRGRMPSRSRRTGSWTIHGRVVTPPRMVRVGSADGPSRKTRRGRAGRTLVPRTRRGDAADACRRCSDAARPRGTAAPRRRC